MLSSTLSDPRSDESIALAMLGCSWLGGPKFLNQSFPGSPFDKLQVLNSSTLLDKDQMVVMLVMSLAKDVDSDDPVGDETGHDGDMES